MEDHPAPSRSDAVVALLVLGLCLVPFLVIGGSAMLVFRPAGFLVAASAAGALVLVVRRRHPWAVWWATTVIGLSAVAVGGGPTSAYLPAIVALYTVSERSSTGRAVLVALVSAVAPVALIIGFGRHGAVDSVAFGMTAWSAVGVMSGLAVRNQLAVVASAHERARLAEARLEEEAQRRVTEERLRIARDLHDVMAHHVSVINVQAGVASYLVHSDPDGAAEAMVHVREASQTVLGEVASILGLLRSVGDGLETAPTPSLGDVDALVERARRAGVQVVLQSTGGPRDLPPIVDLTGYRVVQEALTNAARHGSGRVVVLVDTGGDEVVIEVRNPQSGVAVAYDAPGGHGIAGMGERVLAAGGSLVAGPDGPDAWLVRATLPVTARDQPGVVRRVESGIASGLAR